MTVTIPALTAAFVPFTSATVRISPVAAVIPAVPSHEPYELNWWSKHFGVTKQQLIDAVAKVGTSAAKVKEYLGK